MCYDLPGAKADTRLWLPAHEVEPAAAQQLRNLSALPWVYGIRVMPDCHVGSGATVGSVVAMPEAVAPAAVGTDIGCGMAAILTSLTAADLPDSLRKLRHQLEAAVPVGREAHSRSVNPKDLTIKGLVRRGGVSKEAQKGWAAFWNTFQSLPKAVVAQESRVRKQLGTLGGGNHFIELCLDEQDRVWVMLHSGSRNVGKLLAEYHITKAQALSHNTGLPDAKLAVFLSGTSEMAEYRRALEWAQEYAARSRAVMLALACQTLDALLPTKTITYTMVANCHHNYVSEELIDGQPMLVTRKGAIKAGAGDIGLIPGSMGTKSYMVRGLGNNASYQSASHGAGRAMSRGAAKRTFTVADLQKATEGVECRKDAAAVDEIPGAYKDIDVVIERQRDLVEVLHTLKQVVCVKG